VASSASSVTMVGPSTVDSGAGKDRISGGDTVSAAHCSNAVGDDSKFSFGLGVGAATLTGGAGTGSGSNQVGSPPKARPEYRAAAAVTLDDDTVISFIDVKLMLATISLPQLALN
jgi:hypothetical protein